MKNESQRTKSPLFLSENASFVAFIHELKFMVFGTQNKFNENGQSLLEASIAVGMAVLVIAALAITTLIGLRNSQFAQNQLQATKLAQEAVEKIKDLRDKNIPVCIDNTVVYYWREKPDLIWSLGDEKTTYLGADTIPPNPDICQMTTDTVLTEQSINNIFERKVIIGLSQSNEKKFLVTVSWEDSVGKHMSELLTILSNYDVEN